MSKTVVAWICAATIAASIAVIVYVTYSPVNPQEAVEAAHVTVNEARDYLGKTRQRIASMDAETNEKAVIIREEVKKRVSAMPDDALLDALHEELRLWRMEASPQGVHN